MEIKNRVLTSILILYLSIESIFAKTLVETVSDMGSSLVNFFKSENAVYVLLFISFFWIVFVIVNFGLQKVRHLSGKPAKVIAIMFTILSVSIFFYNKNPEEIISLFKGFIWFVFALFGSILIISSGVFLSKKFEKKTIKTMIISWGIYIGTSLFLPAYTEFFKDAINNNGVTNVIYNFLTPINDISILIATIAFIVFIFGLFSFNLNGIPKSTSRNNPITKLKEYLKDADEEMEKINQYFKFIGEFLTKKQGVIKK